MTETETETETEKKQKFLQENENLLMKIFAEIFFLKALLKR